MNKFTNILLMPLPAISFGFMAAIFFLFGYAYGTGKSDAKETSNNTVVYLNDGTIQINGLKITAAERARHDRQD